MTARRQFPEAVGTVGLIEVKPGSPNVVPGEVYFTVDIRDPDATVLDRMETEIAARRPSVRRASSASSIAVKNIWTQPAVDFDKDCIAAVRAGGRGLGLFEPRHHLTRRPRRGLCFPRRADGDDLRALQATASATTRRSISSKEQCAAGAQVLLQAVLDYDRGLAERFGGR